MTEPSYAHGTGATALLGDTIGRGLDRTIEAYGEREALVDVVSGRRWTYAEFGRDVEELARALMASGVAKGTGSASGRSTAPSGCSSSTPPPASAPSWSTSTPRTGRTSWSTC